MPTGSIARRLLWEYLCKYRRPLGFGIITLAITDALDILPPLIIKYAIDGIEAARGRGFLLQMCGILIISALTQGVTRFFWRKFFLGTSHTIVYDLRQRMYEHLQTLSFGYFNQARTGELMSRLTNDLDEVRMMMGIGFLLAMDALFYFCSVPFLLFWMSPELAFFVMIPLPIIPIFVVKVGGIIHRRSKAVQEKVADLSAKVQENVSGIRVVKTFVRERQEIEHFERISREYVDRTLRLARVESAFHPALELAMGLGVCALIWFGGTRVVNGTISLGAFVAFQAYLMKLVWPMIALGMTINLYQKGMASLGRCAEVLFTPPEIAEEPQPIELPPVPPDSPLFSVRNLTYQFPGTETPVLDQVSFELPPGGTLALVGPVGCGKSTLIHLLLRLYEPPQGTIFLKGREVREYPFRCLREMVGYVPQDTFLFSESIEENLMVGLKDKSDLGKLRGFLQLAGILDEVERLPEALGTLLGERGVNLSGGQKQRMTLARALARDPEILILDDVMSAVDTDTEEKILIGLRSKEGTKKRSVIMVSHRLSSVQHVDRILYFDHGRVVEQGTHQELLDLGGRYAGLWEKQQLKSRMEEELAEWPAPAGEGR